GGGLFYAVGEIFYFVGRRRKEYLEKKYPGEEFQAKEYLGFGDVMLMLMIGSFFGIPLTLETILLGSLGGTLVALPLTVAHARFDLRDLDNFTDSCRHGTPLDTSRRPDAPCERGPFSRAPFARRLFHPQILQRAAREA